MDDLNRSFPPGSLTIISRRAMASDFEIALNDARAERGTGPALDALDEVERIEALLSIFRPESCVSRVNLLASELDVRVEPEVFEILQIAIEFSEQTGGAFDPTASPLWRVWGFAKREGEFPSVEAIERARELTGVEHLRLDSEKLSVAFDEPGVELNFGAIGKGYALDRAAKIMLDSGESDFLIQGGKSSVIARGGRLDDFGPELVRDNSERNDVELDEESGLPKRAKALERSPERDVEEAFSAILPERLTAPDLATYRANRPTGWTVGLAHPLAPQRRLGEFWLRDRALASSGSTYQFFRSGGKRYSHIIDPRTGYPTEGTLATTVVAPTATEADALSTAFFVLGVDAARQFCETRPEIGAVMILESNRAPGYEIVSFNLDDRTLFLY